MEFPVFTLDQFGSGSLIALVAIVHVLISHGAAVGGSIMVVALETYAMKHKDLEMDDFAHRLLKYFFVVTTAVGALTGVGIWLTTGVVQPAAIGSMLRVFSGSGLPSGSFSCPKWSSSSCTISPGQN